MSIREMIGYRNEEIQNSLEMIDWIRQVTNQRPIDISIKIYCLSSIAFSKMKWSNPNTKELIWSTHEPY